MPTDTEQAILDLEKDLAGQENNTAIEAVRTSGKIADLFKGMLDMLKGKSEEKDEKPMKGEDDGDGAQMSLAGLAGGKGDDDPEDDEDPDDDEDEGMEKGTCPHCHKSARASEFGLMSKGNGEMGMLTDDSALISIVCAAVSTEFEASGLSDMAKGMMLAAEVNQGLAESNLALRDIIAEMRVEIDEMRKGQETMIKGLTTRPAMTPAPSPFDVVAQVVAGRRAGERFSTDAEDMNKGDGSEPRAYLTDSQIQMAMAKGIMNNEDLINYRQDRMPNARILDLRKQVSPAA